MSVNHRNPTTGALENIVGISIDANPTSASTNAVSSGGVYTALASKANSSDLGTAASKDSTNAVTQSSTSLVESGAVYDVIPTSLIGTSKALFKPSSGQFTSLFNQASFSPALTNVPDFVEGGMAFGQEYTVTLQEYYGFYENGYQWEINDLIEGDGTANAKKKLFVTIDDGAIKNRQRVVIPVVTKDGFMYTITMWNFATNNNIQTFKMKVDFANGFSSTATNYLFIKNVYQAGYVFY